MTKDEILAFLNAHPVCFLATAEDCKPHVRGMMLARADERGILFHSGGGKEMLEQLRHNPYAEICTWDEQTQVQVRVSGTVAFVDDMELKQQLVEERPFLKPIVDQIGYEAFVVFRIENCVATTWTMADNLAPKTYVKLCE